MTAEQQRDLAQRLKAALESAGIRVTKGVFQGGNVPRWTDVPPELLLGLWMRMAYRIELIPDEGERSQTCGVTQGDGSASPPRSVPVLTLIKGEA